MDKCNPITRIIPATFAWVVLLASTGIFFAFPCRYLMSVYTIAIPIVQSVITFFVLSNFALATFVNPGVIPKAKADELKGDGVASPTIQEIEVHGVKVRLKWCVTCQFYRPPRCVHCGVCDTCIETFDHHCPWVNNCIGRRNYRYFFMFLLWLSIHMISILSLCAFYMKDHLQDLKQLPTIMTLGIVAVIVILFIPIIGLTGYHMMLIMQGRTTNEQVTGKFLDVKSPYTRGCCKNIVYSLCNSTPPKYQTEKSCYSIPTQYPRNLNAPQSLKEKHSSMPGKASAVHFQYGDKPDYMLPKQTLSKDCEESTPAYLNRGRLHLSLSESIYTRPPAKRSRALTPPVPIRFDCSRRSLPPHNRMHAPSPHYAVAQSIHAAPLTSSTRDVSKSCGGGPPPPSYYTSHHYPAKYEPPGFYYPQQGLDALAADSCCLGNQTVDKLQEIASRTMMGGQCGGAAEAFPCKGGFHGGGKDGTPFANHCVDCQAPSSSCQSSVSGDFAARTPGNRPLSFVKAMEMSEALDWSEQQLRLSLAVVPPTGYKVTSPTSYVPEHSKKSDHEVSYEISV